MRVAIEEALRLACDAAGHGVSDTLSARNGRLHPDVEKKLLQGVVSEVGPSADLLRVVRERALFQPRTPQLMSLLKVQAISYLDSRYCDMSPEARTELVAEAVTLAMKASDSEFNTMRELRGAEAERLWRVSEFAESGRISTWTRWDRFKAALPWPFAQHRTSLYVKQSPR